MSRRTADLSAARRRGRDRHELLCLRLWAAGKERLILVDLGVTFPDMDTTPGVDLIMADLGLAARHAPTGWRRSSSPTRTKTIRRAGLLWPQLKAPVYARRFTAALGQAEVGRAPGRPVDQVRHGRSPGRTWSRPGRSRCGSCRSAHSIPESSALVIDTPAGRILHSGDFKIDPTPLVGEPFDDATLRRASAQSARSRC